MHFFNIHTGDRNNEEQQPLQPNIEVIIDNPQELGAEQHQPPQIPLQLQATVVNLQQPVPQQQLIQNHNHSTKWGAIIATCTNVVGLASDIALMAYSYWCFGSEDVKTHTGRCVDLNGQDAWNLGGCESDAIFTFALSIPMSVAVLILPWISYSWWRNHQGDTNNNNNIPQQPPQPSPQQPASFHRGG